APRVARGGPAGDLRRVQRLAGRLAMVARQARPGEERLDAAGAAAVARRPRPLALPRPRERVVSPLAGDPVGPGEHLTVDDDPPAGAGAQDDPEHHAGAGARAVARLREGEAVGVVREPERSGQEALQVAAQRPPV